MALRIPAPGAAGREAGAVLVVDVSAIADPDAGVVDVLAHLTLGARRLGLRPTFVNASPELRDLLALVGLASVLPCPRRLSRGAGAGRTAGRSAGYRGRT